MKKVKISVLALAICLFFVSAGNAFATYDTIAESTNSVSIGHVWIKLNNEDQKANDDLDDEHITSAGTVLPGTEIGKRVSVSNTGTYSAYVRIYLEKYWENTEGERANDLDINKIIVEPASNDWVYSENDGYYYYQKELKPQQETSILMDCFKVSEDINTDVYTGYVGNMEVYAEAVQYENFANLLKKDQEGNIIGWEDVLDFEYREGNSEGEITPLPDDGKNVITQVTIHETGESSVSSMDLFPNFNGAMPGDEILQDIEIVNYHEITREIYLHAEDISSYTKLSEDIAEVLLERITIKVEKEEENGENTLVYQGALRGNGGIDGDSAMYGAENKILLGRFQKNSNAKLIVTLKIPDDWDIDNSETKIKWIFSARNVTDEPTASPTIEPTDIPIPGKTAEPTNAPTAGPTNVPTKVPTVKPTVKPTKVPTIKPTTKPTKIPTETPNVPDPNGPASAEPTKKVTADPNETRQPEKQPVATWKPYCPPKTGDTQKFVLWCISAGVSFVIIIIITKGLFTRKA